MKKRIYIKLGKTDSGRIKVYASTKPSYRPFDNGYYKKSYFPTVSFAIDLQLSDDVFKQAEIAVGELNINVNDVVEAATIGDVPKDDKE